MDDANAPFGTARLLAQLDETRARPLDASLAALLDLSEAWRGRGRVHDDLSVLAVERALVGDGPVGT